MMDLISRQDVLELIDNYNSDGLGSVFFSYADGEKFKNAILALPSAQKTGKWIIFPSPFIEEICMCSNCKTKFMEAYQHRNICPNCGAHMRGEEE